MSIKVGRSEPPLAAFYVEKQPWMEDAACKGKPTSMFFDDIETRAAGDRLKAQRIARSTCSNCPVRKECAEQALLEEGSAPGGRYGYRGCLTPAQRRKLYRTGGLRGRDPKRVPL